MSQLLLIDNYDSFTYNLYHYLEELSSCEIVVMRNDEIDVAKAEQCDRCVISPGPGLPSEAGKLMSFLARNSTRKKLLGVCLGHQAIAETFGMKLTNLKEVVHGQSSRMKVEVGGSKLFQGLPKSFNVARYHSWVVNEKSLNEDFLITSKDSEGNIMAMEHKELPIYSVQFHPESILTEFGKGILKNWIEKT